VKRGEATTAAHPSRHLLPRRLAATAARAAPAAESLKPERSSADLRVAAWHVIGRLLDLSHINWRRYVADQLSDHTTRQARQGPGNRLPPRLGPQVGHDLSSAYGRGLLGKRRPANRDDY
jgi:hypothetical protein